MCLGASNVSFGLPQRRGAQRRVPADGDGGRADQRDHVGRPACASRRSRASDLLLGHDPWGASWIAAHRARQAALADRRRRPRDEPARPAAARLSSATTARGSRRELRRSPETAPTASACGSCPTAPRCGCPAGRRCSTPPAGTGSRSTRPAAATAPARSARSGSSPARSRWAARPARVHAAGAAPGVAAGLPGRRARRPRGRGAAAADAAEGGAGRRRAPRDPAPLGAEAPPGARRALARGSALRRAARARRDRRPGADDFDRIAARVRRRSSAASNFDVTAVVCDEELIDVEPGDTTARRFAIAFDLGTTTVVATLLDLDSGQPVAVRSILNHQQPYGADVITRISATMMDEQALPALRERAHETLAELTAEVCAEGGVDPREVYEITACGNVTMMHLALGIDPEPLSMAPFVVSTHTLPPIGASEFGGRHPSPRARRSCSRRSAPTWAATSSPGMLATGLTRDRRLRLFIDVGTNSEIALGSSERVLATAAPAGPAFEAAQIKCGMRAADGAIEGVKIDGDSLELEVIGDGEPAGHLRVRARRRGRGAGPLRPARPLRALSRPTRTRRRCTPMLAPGGWRRSARSGCSCCTGAATTSKARCSFPSATYASCSSPRRRSRPAGRSCSGSSASRPTRSPRCCSRAASAPI